MTGGGSPVGPGELGAARSNPQVLVDSDVIWSAVKRDLSRARRRALVQTYAFDGDGVGESLASVLASSTARDRRLLVDSYSRVNQSDRWLVTPGSLFDTRARAEARNRRRLMRELAAEGVGVRLGRPFGFLGRRFFDRDHKKLVLFDDHVVYLGGLNFTEHNFRWHEVMIRYEDEELAAFLRDDFESSWRGDSVPAVRDFPHIDTEIHLLAGSGNREAMIPIIRLMEEAEKSIDVISPYVSPPFTDHLSAAAGRGVHVRVVTPGHNNKGYLQDYLLAEAAGLGLDVRLYEPGMLHLKFMLIDGRVLVGGSSNFDLMSYHGFLAEQISVIRHPEVVDAFRRLVLEPDLEASNAYRPAVRRTRLSAPANWIRGLPVRAGCALAAMIRPR